MPHDEGDLQRSLDDLMHERVNTLSAKSFDELSKFPGHVSEELTLRGDKYIVSVWHDTLPTAEHRFIVQAYKPGILGFGKMQAVGFVMNSRGERRPLTLEEWAPFS